MMENVDNLRWTGIKLITLGGWFVAISLLTISVYSGQNTFWAGCASAALNIVPTLACLARSTSRQTRDAVAIMAALQPAVFVYAMQGSAIQLDFHLYFFVALAALTSLCAIRPIIIASLVIVLHHLVLSFTAPDWVFYGGGGVGRVMVHGFATFSIALILCAVTAGIRRTLSEVAKAREDSLAQTQQLERQSGELKNALERAREERSARERAEQARNDQRHEDIEEFLQDFESSIATVIKSVSQTAYALGTTVKELDAIATETGSQAGDFSDAADAASQAAKTVARGVAELSTSITNIAVNVNQQDELTTLAARRASSGGGVVGSLTEHSDTIEEATRAIVRIAERTNLLSLNAAIEAARAGPSGRGFTIVAQEVKGLATQAAKAATEIEEFLSGVRTGTFEAERSFQTIDEAIAELDQAAKSIRSDVDGQRQSADTIQSYARNSANKVNIMAEQSKALASSAGATKKLSGELDQAASALAENIRNLESSTQKFVDKLRAA